MSESVWLSTSDEKIFPSLDGDIEADVAVAGGGITGMVDAQLTERGSLPTRVLNGPAASELKRMDLEGEDETRRG